jgi:DNA-directed RNA polymerase specialized sigma24 family protein
MKHAHPSDEPDRERAWQLFRQHRQLLSSLSLAAARRFSVPVSALLDYEHDFVVVVLPRALKSFDPALGSMERWLSVVYKRYLVGELTATRSAAARLHLIDDWEKVAAADEQLDDSSDLAKAASILGRLPPLYRDVLGIYLTHGATVETIAREKKWSRHEALQRTAEGLTAAAVLLGDAQLLTPEELSVCRGAFLEGRSIEELSSLNGLTEHQVRERLRHVVARMVRAAVVTKGEKRHGHL